ncbi:MAG: hypothetical protein AWU57_2374 [Marinobacter sp. T13-3]|jgi:hypothetical protein|nr:MAG: hypothetical protein AWU57_2374 [Marinobacter sp. T13-3]
MNDRLEDVFFQDNGEFISGVSQQLKDLLYFAYDGDDLALKYDFSARPGDEFTRLTVIHDCDRGSKSVPESELTHLYVQLGHVATKTDIEAIQEGIKPLIDNFKKSYDEYHALDTAIRWEDLAEKYNEMKDQAEELVKGLAPNCDSIRSNNEAASDYYYGHAELLEALVQPDMTDEQIDLVAIEEVFINGVLFHPHKIASVLTHYRDHLLAQASATPDRKT